MANEKVMPVELLHVKEGIGETRSDLLAVEEPLEIRLGYGKKEREQKCVSVTMRTPGNDFELAVGFLFTEGVIESYEDVEHIHYCQTDKEEEKQNIVRIELKPSVVIDWKKLKRHFYTSSSCGVCGKSSIEAVKVDCNYLSDDFQVEEDLIYNLPERLSGHQHVFSFTGGIHASALLDLEGNPIFVREDVGRHNALDKVVGADLMSNLSNGKIIVVSGRASFELVQKAAKANFPVMVAVGAPSSIAVRLAADIGLTLIGFTKPDRFNIYTGKERIKL